MEKVSIITAVKNRAVTIADTLNSLYGQTHRDVEHIVIDGGSTDGTLSILERHRNRISKLISEPDQGLYDALNKGIRAASGDVIGILHADDVYADEWVLNDVLRSLQDTGADTCYGDLVYVARTDPGKVVRYWRAKEPDRDRFLWGWMPPHPTFFVGRSLYEQYGFFNTELGSAADYELLLRFLYRHKVSSAYIPRVLVRMRTGGISNASLGSRLHAHRMDRLAWKVNGLTAYPWTLLLKPLRKLPQFAMRPTRG